MKYNELSKTGVLVSELCLGTMTFGVKGGFSPIGKIQQEEANKVVKTALDNGINFFDTANVYSEGLSESILGNSLKDLGVNRQHVFIATKVRGRMGPGANQVGLSRLHILYSVDDSLQRLGLDHIDLLYLHSVDPLTPVEETMQGLEEVVRSGKVRYLGVSNFPAWKIMKANSYAEHKGWNKFVAMQHYYSIASRDIERELVPMAVSERLSVIPWSPLAGGFLSGKYNRNVEKAGDARRDQLDFPPVNREKAYDIIDLMLQIGKEHKASAAQVALAWMLRKPAVTSIITGVRNEAQLLDNIASTELSLSGEEMKQLDSISALSPEYPGWMLERQGSRRSS